MRLTVFCLFISIATPGLAGAETASPIFGGTAMGTFEVADNQASAAKDSRVVVRPANDCTAPDCTASLTPANLPVSGRKP